uniref:Uncharacterized protein n=1 Tax=Micromonas pusilla TaxID=38833 RepID=A0A7S0IBU7_MICPS|mmetsp:Transcript_15059/g.63384  ORF Transcript_15059/g.63384 Transcript_15059/m.63384 type:complete len:103 (+) Transcript_15059:230-538(+)
MAKQFYGEAANFPGAPENFDPSDPLADKVAAIAQREHVVREKMVKIETAKLLRERVQECYKLEGVNHYQNCKEEVKAYLESIKNVGVHRSNIGPNDKAIDQQ